MSFIRGSSSGTTIRGSAEGTTIRGKSLDSIVLSYETTQKVVSEGSTTAETVDDANVIRSSSGVYDNEAIVSYRLSGISSSPVLSSVDEGIATVNSNGVVTRVSDGTAQINATTRYGARAIFVPVSRSSSTTTDRWDSWRSGSLGDHLLRAIDALMGGKTAPVFTYSGDSVLADSTICDIYSAPGVRNSSGWWESTDLTAIPRHTGGGGINGVLVTPRDLICANHFIGGSIIGWQWTFDDNSGHSYVRTVVSTGQVGDTDIQVVTFDSDLPAGITPSKVLPYDWRDYAPNTKYGYLVLATNQDRRLVIGGTTNFAEHNAGIYINQSFNPDFDEWFYGARKNDSGSPVMMLINDELVTLFTYHFSGSGDSISENLDDVNDQITANGSPHALSEVSLTSFNSYA